MDISADKYDENLSDAVDLYGDTLFRIAFFYTKDRCDAEDIVQDAFIKYVTVNKPQFESALHLKNWLIKVVVNKCKDLKKSASKKRNVSLDEAEEIPMQEAEQEDGLAALIKRLPPMQSTAILMYYYEDYSINEIAELLNRNKITVGQWLRRGRIRLKQYIEDDDESGFYRKRE
ncbi:MAG: RNA polymerase sigma factor [Clostridia bacterium]|nr:RNA polymerase sigma factor [Clostridia bacterium]